VYGPNGMPIEQVSSGGTVTYLHHDQQGSTRLLTGSTGTVTGSTTFDAYGNKTGSTGTSTTPLGYDGQYTSTDTGPWEDVVEFDHRRAGTWDRVFAKLADGRARVVPAVLQGQRVAWDGGETRDIVGVLNERLIESRTERLGKVPQGYVSASHGREEQALGEARTADSAESPRDLP
jgi:hypothetical protein